MLGTEDIIGKDSWQRDIEPKLKRVRQGRWLGLRSWRACLDLFSGY